MSAEPTAGPIGAPLRQSGASGSVSGRSGLWGIHSWRNNAACELVEAGFSDDLVAAVTGKSPAMALHDTKNIRQKVRALQAQQRRLNNKFES